MTAADVAGVDQAGPSADEQPPQTVQTAPAAGDRVVVTARRVEEDVQDVPIPVAVLGEDFLADTGAYNAGKITQLAPSVQFYSTNPRNTAINIRAIERHPPSRRYAGALHSLFGKRSRVSSRP